MKRTTVLLVVLGLVLTVVLWFLLLWQPSTDELAAVETQIETVQANQSTTRARMGQLQSVRERAPELQAELTTARTIVPDEASLPVALRQLQLAADESGATLVSVAPARPVAVEGVETGLHNLAVNFEVRGSYFQILDTLRRLEDPAISPRGFVWDNLSISIEEHPTLIANVTGRMFAVLPGQAPDAAVAAPDAAATDPSTEAPADPAVEGDAPADDVVATEGELQ